MAEYLLLGIAIGLLVFVASQGRRSFYQPFNPYSFPQRHRESDNSRSNSEGPRLEVFAGVLYAKNLPDFEKGKLYQFDEVNSKFILVEGNDGR